MKTRKVGLIVVLLITLIVLGGCGNQSDQEYHTRNFQGIEYKVPKEWVTFNEDKNGESFQYNFRYNKESELLFYVYSYPIEKYNSKFIDYEDNTYKDMYSLKTVEQLSSNKELLLFQFQAPPGVKVVGEVYNTEIYVMIVKLKDKILEVTWDIPDKYYQDHKDVIQYMQDSITISN